jgi:hypothetical protein
MQSEVGCQQLISRAQVSFGRTHIEEAAYNFLIYSSIDIDYHQTFFS